MGATKQTAYEVAEKIERRLYQGISTARILRMIVLFMKKEHPHICCLYDLRRGLSLMNPKPEFELFIQALLAQNGFEVSPNQILVGNCVEHEVDAVAKKNGITYFVEAKHHFNYHTLTGLDESRIARALLEDVTEAYENGKTSRKIDRAMIVTNTKYSEHAIRYGNCRNILQIGWNVPTYLSLQYLIEEPSLYPLSCLKALKREHRAKLVNSGIVLMKHIVQEKPGDLAIKTGLPKQIIDNIREQVEQATSFP